MGIILYHREEEKKMNDRLQKERDELARREKAEMDRESSHTGNASAPKEVTHGNSQAVIFISLLMLISIPWSNDSCRTEIVKFRTSN